MAKIRKYKYLVFLITVPVLLLFISNSLINRHNHIVRGFVFSHAHPFHQGKDDHQYPPHHHTDAEIIILDLLSNIDILVFFMLISIGLLAGTGKLMTVISPYIQAVPAIPFYSPRGPPVYTF
ncbi:MAG: hypothetical protein ACQERS_08850 [Bacteroidota bacterium]